jgi:hypothetical protein
LSGLLRFLLIKEEEEEEEEEEEVPSGKVLRTIDS